MCGRWSRATRILLGAFLACLLVSRLAHAQRSAGEVRLEVKDPSGAAVAASGRLHNLASGTVQNYQTDAQGTHSFTGLPYGRYRLEVTAGGFATQSVIVNVQSGAPVPGR